MNIRDIRRFFGDIDYYLLIPTFLLCMIGIVAIYSSNIDANGIQVSREYAKQIIWFAIGFVLLIVASVFDFFAA